MRAVVGYMDDRFIGAYISRDYCSRSPELQEQSHLVPRDQPAENSINYTHVVGEASSDSGIQTVINWRKD